MHVCDAMQRNAMQCNATQRSATQHNAAQRGLGDGRHCCSRAVLCAVLPHAPHAVWAARANRYSSLGTRWLAADPALLVEAKATHGVPLGSAKSLWLSLELLAIVAAQLVAAVRTAAALQRSAAQFAPWTVAPDHVRRSCTERSPAWLPWVTRCHARIASAAPSASCSMLRARVGGWLWSLAGQHRQRPSESGARTALLDRVMRGAHLPISDCR